MQSVSVGRAVVAQAAAAAAAELPLTVQSVSVSVPLVVAGRRRCRVDAAAGDRQPRDRRRDTRRRPGTPGSRLLPLTVTARPRAGDRRASGRVGQRELAAGQGDRLRRVRTRCRRSRSCRPAAFAFAWPTAAAQRCRSLPSSAGAGDGERRQQPCGPPAPARRPQPPPSSCASTVPRPRPRGSLATVATHGVCDSPGVEHTASEDMRPDYALRGTSAQPLPFPA